MINGLGLDYFSFLLSVLQQNGRRISRDNYLGENLAFALGVWEGYKSRRQHQRWRWRCFSALP
jgi:hypothetical protein